MPIQYTIVYQNIQFKLYKRLLLCYLQVYMHQEKKPCKFKGECKNFIAKIECGFSHDVCKFGKSCKYGDKCKSYHPPNFNTIQTAFIPPNSAAIKRPPVSKTPCRFGQKCLKKQTGQCPFMHDNLQPQQTNKLPKNMQCRYGQTCIKVRNGQCPFTHKSMPTQNVSKKEQFQQYCPDFMFNRCSEEQQQCPRRLKHIFTKNNSLKRLYYTTKYQNTIKDVKILYIDRAHYYVIHNTRSLYFMKFNQAKRLMQSATNFQLVQTDQINKIAVQQSLICYSIKNEIVFFKPQSGLVQRAKNQHQNQIVNLIFYDEKTLISHSIGQPIKIWVEGSISQELTNKISNKLGNISNKVYFIKRLQIMGEKIIIGGSENTCIFWNKSLDSNIIPLENKVIIDADCIVNMGHPFCIITVYDNKSNTSEILCIDLICFQIHSVVNKKIDFSDERFQKILIINQYCFIQVSTGCVLIYLIPSFEQIAGIIAFTNRLLSMQKTKENKLIILQSRTGNIQGSFSIYKLE